MINMINMIIYYYYYYNYNFRFTQNWSNSMSDLNVYEVFTLSWFDK